MRGRDAAQDARDALRRYWSDSDIPPVPVDPIVIARTMGAEVFAADLAVGVSGQLDADGGEYRISLSRDNGPLRQRFTCAHEVGHLYAHRMSGGPSKFVDYRDGRSAQGMDSHEVYANQFAAELLMPESLVRWYAQNGWTTSQMASQLGVSLSAMGYRRENLAV